MVGRSCILKGYQQKWEKINNYYHSINYLSYSSNLSVFQPYLYPARMIGRTGQQVFHNSPCPFAAALVFFQDDINLKAGVDIASVLAVHNIRLGDEFFDGFIHLIKIEIAK